MDNKLHQEQETVEANNDIKDILEDGKVLGSNEPGSKTEEANLKINEQFNKNDESHNLIDNPATIVTPQ